MSRIRVEMRKKGDHWSYRAPAVSLGAEWKTVDSFFRQELLGVNNYFKTTVRIPVEDGHPWEEYEIETDDNEIVSILKVTFNPVDKNESIKAEEVTELFFMTEYC